MPGKLTIGTAPDSWGVWFPSDPEQVSADVFLRKVVDAAHEAIELGPNVHSTKPDVPLTTAKHNWTDRQSSRSLVGDVGYRVFEVNRG